MPSSFTDAQRKFRLWLEDVEQTLLNDKVRLTDAQAIQNRKKNYKDLLDQTLDQEHRLENLNKMMNEFSSQLTVDSHRRLQEELTNYNDRLYDVKMFLSERLTKCHRLDQTLTEFQVNSMNFVSKKKTFVFLFFSERC